MLVERVAAAIRCVRHRKPQSTRYIHRFSSIFAILHRVWHRDPQLTRYVFRFSTVFAILWCKIIAAEYFLSNVSRFFWPLFECIAFWREFSRFFPSFQKESFCKSIISIDSRPLVGPASEKPGIAKLSISFKFLLKIDDFRRRADSEKPGMHFLSRSF